MLLHVHALIPPAITAVEFMKWHERLIYFQRKSMESFSSPAIMVHNLVNQFILSVSIRSISTKLILWCDGIVTHMYNLIIIDIDYQHIAFSNNVSN